MPTPAHKPTDATREAVALLTAAGVTEKAICKIIGVTDKTLMKYYRHERENGSDIATGRIAGVLFQGALQAADDPRFGAQAMFWLKTRAGWRETQNIEINDRAYLVAAESLGEGVDSSEWLAQHNPELAGGKANGNGKAH